MKKFRLKSYYFPIAVIITFILYSMGDSCEGLSFEESRRTVPHIETDYPCKDHDCGCTTSEMCATLCCCAQSIMSKKAYHSDTNNSTSSNVLSKKVLSKNSGLSFFSAYECQGPSKKTLQANQNSYLKIASIKLYPLFCTLHHLFVIIHSTYQTNLSPPDKIPIVLSLV